MRHVAHSCTGMFPNRQGQSWQFVLNKRQYEGFPVRFVIKGNTGFVETLFVSLKINAKKSAA